MSGGTGGCVAGGVGRTVVAVVGGVVVGGIVVVAGSVVDVEVAAVVVVARGCAVVRAGAARCDDPPHAARVTASASAPPRAELRGGIGSVAYSWCFAPPPAA
jgi:hypothetical protein